MRKAVFLLCALLFLLRIGLATELSGPLTGNLPLSGSPYQVVGDIWVPQSGSLVIEPGVALDFQGYCKFSIKQGATLQAVGTAADSIVFSCDTLLNPQKWVGIRFDASASNSVMQYCRVENAKESGIALIHCSLLVQNCLITNNRGGDWYYGDSGAGIACLENSNAVIRNCTISGNVAGVGGGIFAATDCYLTIEGNDISHNANYYGAGIYIVDCVGADIKNNNISDNIGDDGTAINLAWNESGRFSIVANFIARNEALYSGPIMYLNGANGLVMKDNVIAHNISPMFFSAVYICQIAEDGVVMTGNLIVSNVNNHGGGVDIQSSNLVFVNNVIANNSAAAGGRGVQLRYGHAEIKNSIFWNNHGSEIDADPESVDVSYCDVEGGYPGVGNIDTDPLFRDTTSGDYHLMTTVCGDPFDSPCIDAGSPEFWDELVDCDHGLGSQASDIGAYGGGFKPCSYVVGDANDNGSADGVDVVYLVNYFKLGIAPGYICDCPEADDFYAPADVNGSCEANGVDVIYYVNFLKGYGPGLTFCPECPPILK